MTRSNNARRWYPLAGLAVGLAVVAAIACTIALSPPLSATAAPSDTAKDKAAEKPQGDKTDGPASLALKRVVLFNSGVGFFEHSGQVQGNAKVQLQFKTKDINDLLKSMVVQDLDGGHIASVGYGSNDPLERRLSSFAVNLNGSPRLAAILQQIRGERVEVDAPNKIVGTIVALETRKIELGKDKIVEVDVLNLLTDEGLRSVVLENISRIKLLNDRVSQELRKALDVLATAHDTDKKTVTLNFKGTGDRKVRIGYVEEAPVWKTSYRLVLADEKPAVMQGWAIVENPTEEDWNDVRLTLVSGRPISFVMDLYQPLYIPRPVVELERYASLRPQTYGQDLARRDMEFRKAARPEMAARRAMAAPGAPAAAGFAMADRAREAEEAKPEPGWDPTRGVQSVATAANVGELFQYAIATPVSLSRHESAMLPIITGEVKAEKVSIYNPAVQPKHPLAGLRLINSTDLHLMQGPITVFDGGAYAGDAKIEDLAPGSQRLLSYALDLDTEVALDHKGGPEELVSVRLFKGTLIAERKYSQVHEYTVKNSGRRAKNVLIEQPIDQAWTLVAPKEPTEKTRDLYRFAVKAEPGEPAKLAVAQQRVDQQQIALTNLDDNTVAYFTRAKVVSDKVKAALAEVMRRKQALGQVAQKRTQLGQQIQVIEQEQARIRENMGRLDRNTDLYKRYVKKFTDQEDEIEKFRSKIAEFQEEENTLRKSLDEYLMGLEL